MQININEFWLVIIILIAGLLGGSVNYIIGKKDEAGFKTWASRAIVGVTASFLMPLFLETISSDLVHSVLSKSDSSSGDVFVLFGFCLIGAISSRVLIRTLSDKILEEVKNVKEAADKTIEKVSELESEVDPIIEQSTEQDDITSSENEISKLSENLDEKAISILKSLIHPRYTLRSKSGISKETGLDLSVVSDKLIILKENSLADEIQGRRGPRWFITSRGYRLVGDIKGKS